MSQAPLHEKLPVSVLCIDDEQPLLEIITLFLTPYVSELHTASSGNYGLKLFMEKRPDIIITDLMMPDLNGLQISRMIKEASPATPVILMTAFYSTEYMAEAIDIGINQFVPKPISRSKMMTALERCYHSIDLERKFSFEHDRAKLLASALEQSQTGVIILDPAGNIEYLNPACRQMYANAGDDAVGRPVQTIGIQTDIIRWMADVEECGQPVEIEIEQLRDNKEEIWINLKISRFDNHQTSIRFFVAIDDITAKKTSEKKLRYLATHDSLTGLFNRAYFEDELHRISVGRNFPISLVIADIDRLKSVNDRFGHETGDRLIVKAAEILRETFRAEDVVARIGGDEFAAILPGAAEEVARESILRGLLRKKIIAVGSEEIEVSLSFGCSTAMDSSMVKEMLKLADDRMYTEKTAKHRNSPGEEVAK